MTEHHAAGLAAAGRVPVRRAALVVVLAAALGIGIGVIIHAIGSRSHPSAGAGNLPDFHGQASWGTGERAAPAFTLRDQAGAPVSLSALRGRPVLLTFLDSRCKQECPIQGRQLASILRRLPAAQRPVLLVVSADPSGATPATIRRAVAEWGLAGPWAWHWLNGSRTRLATVWRSYGVTVKPGSGDSVHSLVLYLIDRQGFERTAYLYPFLPAFVQGDLSRIARGQA